MPKECCDALEEIPTMIHRGMIFEKNEHEVPKLIFCSPQGDIRVLPNRFIETGEITDYQNAPLNDPAKTPTQTYTLENAIRFAGKHTKVQLLPGKYYQPVYISKQHTNMSAPLTISGMGKKTILCGTNSPTNIYPELPGADDYAFIKIKDTNGIVIENLYAEGCWPCFVFAENCQNVHIKHNHIQDGRYPIFAAGPDSEDFEITHNYWKQDPSEAIWQDIDWLYTHHTHYSHMNGGFFGSLNFKSGIIFSHNTIEYAFNGLRMATETDDLSGRNLNVQIYANTFRYIRDNAIEPEGHALNWHIYHNEFINNHAPFSFDNVAGGHWLIYGNIGWFNDQPGMPYQTGRGGKIFKFGKHPKTSKDSYIFNNSWYTRSYAIKKSNINHLHHFNNAYQFCDHANYTDQHCLCISRDALTKKLPENAIWPSNLYFDYDISTAGFGELKDKYKQEKHGITDQAFEFKDSLKGDLRLKTPKQAKGKPLCDVFNLKWVSSQSKNPNKTKKIAIGAYQGDTLTKGPEFKKYE